MKNSYTRYVRRCEECPLYIDPDPHPTRCEHPLGGKESYLVDGEGRCPLKMGAFVVKILDES